MAQRGCRDLMRALLAEFRVRAEARARAAARVALAAARGSSPRPAAGRHRALIAKLLATVALPLVGGHPPKLAQAP